MTAGVVGAAVALIRVPDPDQVLLIERAARAGDPWSGQMGLPGGHVEPADADLIATAIRETEEEVGIPLPRTALVRTLPDVAPKSITPPPFLVRPFVFQLSARPPVHLSAEVASADWIAWAEFLDPANRREVRVTLPGFDRTVPAFVIGGRVIWGMTERVLAPLVGGDG